MAAGQAVVKEVVSGDTLVLVGASRGGPPPTKRVSLSSVVAPRVALKSLTQEIGDEPFGWPAREFMRQRLIGQTVTFSQEYSFNGRDFACVTFQGENVANELLRQGLAKLRESKNPPHAHDLEELEECEAEARSRQRGVWSVEGGSETIRVMHWGVGDTAYCQSFAQKYKHQELPAVVEFVRDGSSLRLAIRLSKEGHNPACYAYCAVSLTGIICPASKRDSEGNLVPEPFSGESRCRVSSLRARKALLELLGLKKRQLGRLSFGLCNAICAAEARYFVEIRLLNRDVKLRVEGADDFGNLLGTVLHPNGNISLLLLKNGFATVSNATAALAAQPQALRAALKEAQINRLRRWKDFQLSSASDALQKSYAATVLEAVSGDCVVLLLGDDTERRVYLASIRCPRPGGPGRVQSKEEETLAFEARELVRKKAVGKKVRVCLEYVKEPFNSGGPAPPPSDSAGRMHFVSLYIQSAASLKESPSSEGREGEEKKGLNVSELLLQAGLAKTVPHRAEDEQAERYDVYLALEKQAQEAKKGVFCPQGQLKLVRIVDLLGSANAQRAIAHLQQLQRGPLSAIVEFVFNAARFKLRVPSENVYISFVLGGIKAPQPERPGGVQTSTASAISSNKTHNVREPAKGEPLAAETVAFSRRQVLQREVVIEVEQCDRGGNFIGTLRFGGEKKNFAVELLQRGFASTVEFSLQRSPHKDELAEAEKTAKENRCGIWGLPGALEEEDAAKEGSNEIAEAVLTGLTVSHVESFNLFFLQDDKGPLLHRISETLEGLDPPTADERFTLAGLPRKGEIILAKFSADDQWYRARVEGRDSGGQVLVLYVDYGNTETVDLERIRRCPASLGLKAIAAQAIPCCFSGLLPPPDMEREASAFFSSLTEEKSFRVQVEGLNSSGRRMCVLCEGDDVENKRPSVNERLLAAGLAIVDKKSSSKFLDKFRAEEAVARKQHLNVWRYGDVGDDEEQEEFPSIRAGKRAPPRR